MFRIDDKAPYRRCGRWIVIESPLDLIPICVEAVPMYCNVFEVNIS